VERLLEDQCRRWRRGEAVPVEAYREQYPELAGDPDGLLDLIFNEVIERQQRGQTPALEEYLERFPSCAGRLRGEFELHRALAASVPAQPPAPAEVPIIAGRYRLRGEISRGGGGIIFRARDLELGRDLAVKVLLEAHRGQPVLVRRFLEEAQVSGQLQHPAIVPVHEVGELADGRPYFAMKLVQGRTLAALLRDRPAPEQDRPRFLQVFASVCQAVAYAHSKGVIHRDLKPSNVMVGEFGEVQVMDWGLAKILAVRDEPGAQTVRTVRTELAGASTQVGAVLGTLSYMAPEQARGEVEALDERCDVFGLGAILCEILTGQPPHSGPREELLNRAAGGDLTDAGARLAACGADAELLELARWCLAPVPADRPRDAGVVARALQAYLTGVEDRLRQAELARAEAQARALHERKTRRRTVALAVTVLLAGLLLGSGWLWLDRQRREQAVAVAVQVQGALDRGTLLRDQGRWGEALAEVEPVQPLLRRTDLAGHLRRQAEAMLTDLRTLKRLALVRTLKAEMLSNLTADTDYAKAFADFGITEGMPVEEAAALIRARPEKVAVELAGSLDDWVLERRRQSPSKDWRWLVAIARAADRDPWRDRLRAQILQPDDAALAELADPARVERLPVRSVELLGRVLLDRGAADRALAVLEEAQRRHPDDVWINYLLAGAALNVRPSQTDKAIRHFSAAAALRPEARHLLVLALLSKGSQEEALAIALDLVRRGPNDPLNHSLLTRVYLERKDSARAIAAARKATQLSPKSPRFHNNLGLALHSAKRLDEARTVLLEALRLAPTYAACHNNLGNILDDLGRTDEAIAAWETAVRHSPGETHYRHNLARALLKKGRLGEALAHYQQILASNPCDGKAHHGLGATLQRQQKYPEAVAALRNALALGAGEANSYFSLGAALHGTAAYEEAHSAYEEALRLQPDHVEALEALAQSFVRKGDLDRAAETYRKALRYDDKLIRGHFVVAGQFERQGRFAEALAASRRAAELGRNDPTWRELIAKELPRVERLARLDARREEVLAGKGQPASVDERIELARFCYLNKRHYRTAARLFAEALAERPALADNLRAGHVYGAACAAAQAGCGRGGDAPQNEADRARLRAEAHTWLRADLARWKKWLAKGPREGALVRKAMRFWQRDADVACVRDKAALEKVPPDERRQWEKFWADVASLSEEAATNGPTGRP
jgi:serine/threonine-protein kinase